MEFPASHASQLVPVRMLLVAGIVLYTTGFVSGIIAFWLIH